MAQLVPNIDYGYSQEEAVDPYTPLEGRDLALLSAFNAPAAPLATAFGPMKVDASMYAPQQSGTPWDIISGIGKRMQYDTATQEAEKNRNAYGQAMSQYKTETAQAAQEAAFKKRREMAVASFEAALSRGEVVPEQRESYINAVEAGATPAPLVRGIGIGTQIAEAENQKATNATLEKDLAQAKTTKILRDRVSSLINGADPAMFQVEGRVVSGVKDFATKIASLTGIPELQQTPEDKKFLTYYRQLTGSTQALKSAFLKSTSGATVTDKEMARLDNVLPVVDGVLSFDSSATAKAKIAEFNQIQDAVIARLEWMRKEGVVPKNASAEELKAAAESFPLEMFPDGNLPSEAVPSNSGATFTLSLPDGVKMTDGVHSDADGNKIEVKGGKYREIK